MMVKSTLLAVLLSLIIFGSLGVVQAQTFTNGGVDPAHLVGLGWNYGHLSNRAAAYDGSTIWFTATSQENPSGYFYTNNPSLATLVAPACQTGNWVGVYVTSLNPIKWIQAMTFTFK